MTDPVADMLTRVRNAGKAGHKWADIPVSKLKREIGQLLKESFFIHDFKVLNDGKFGVLRIYLKYHDGNPVIRHLERISRPGQRRYMEANKIPKVRNGLGMGILSTSRGLMSDKAARKEGVGGELMAMVW